MTELMTAFLSGKATFVNPECLLFSFANFDTLETIVHNDRFNPTVLLATDCGYTYKRFRTLRQTASSILRYRS